MQSATGHVRIGELSRRTGVSPELLRAWEHRYGLLRPLRSEGGFRLYSPQDERRVAVMRAHLEYGLSAAEAARLTVDEEDAPAPPAETPVLERSAGELRAALDALDEEAAQSALDRLFSGFSLATCSPTGSSWPQRRLSASKAVATRCGALRARRAALGSGRRSDVRARHRHRRAPARRRSARRRGARRRPPLILIPAAWCGAQERAWSALTRTTAAAPALRGPRGTATAAR